MNDFILFCILFAIIGGAIWYIISQKQKGAKCIGCSCGCSCDSEDKKSCTSNGRK